MTDFIIRRHLADRPTEKAVQKRIPPSLWKNILKYRWLYLLILPALIYFVIFQYIPLWNAQIAFKDFKPLLGVWGSPWTGFDHFKTFFDSYYFKHVVGNTIMISFLKLVLGIPTAICLAIALYETCFRRFRAFVQTVAYLP